MVKRNVLRLDKVNAFYGPIQALSDVTLDVPEGEIVTLLGPNGAGKTTLLKVVSGLLPCSSGTVEFDNHDITYMKAHLRRRLGLTQVPEGRRIFKGMSIRENLELGSFSLHDQHEREQRMKTVFGRFPVLESRQYRDASSLSGGEQQMLAIGRAMMAQTKLLLLDEPSMGLAPLMVQELMLIIKQLNESGTTILLVEQNANVALKLASYGYVLENGRIAFEGQTAELQGDPKLAQAYLGV